MPNLRIVPYNVHDDATVTASVATATGFPADNTQNCIRSRVWRATDDTSQSINGVLAADRDVNSLFIFRHTAHGGDIQLRLYSDNAFATQIYDSTALPANNITPTEVYDWGINENDPFRTDFPYWLYFPEETIRSYRITFSGSPTAAQWQVSRIILGKYFEVGINPSYGLQLGYATDTDRNRTRGGSLRTNIGAIWPTMNIDFGWVEEEDRATWLDILRHCGTGRDFALSLFPDDEDRRERDYTLNAKMTSLNALGRQVSWLTNRIQIEGV